MKGRTLLRIYLLEIKEKLVSGKRASYDDESIIGDFHYFDMKYGVTHLVFDSLASLHELVT